MRTATIGFTATIIVALVLATRFSLDVVVFGVLLVGSAHLLFEVRFVLGRYRHLLHGRTLIGINLALAAIIAVRLGAVGSWSRQAEIVLLVGLLVYVVATRVERGWRRGLGLAAVLGAGAAALAATGSWFVVQSWLHNLVPAVFLWEWSGAVRSRTWRRAFRTVTLVWVLAVPAIVLAGAADAFVTTGSTTAVTVGATAGVTSSILPAGAGSWAPRLLAVFAFLQLLHYTTWCWHIPRTTAASRERFEQTPVGRQVRGRRFLLTIALLTGLVIVVAAVDYIAGRSLYTSLASYHAYLEYPVLLALLLDPVLRPTRDEAPFAERSRAPLEETTT